MVVKKVDIAMDTGGVDDRSALTRSHWLKQEQEYYTQAIRLKR